MRNMAKKCFFRERAKSDYFQSASSDRENKWFFVLGLGTTMPCKNIGTNDKFCRKAAVLNYTERLKFKVSKLEFSFKTKTTPKTGHKVAILVIMAMWLIRPKNLSLKSFYKYSKVVLTLMEMVF